MTLSTDEIHMAASTGGLGPNSTLVPLCILATPGLVDSGRRARVRDIPCQPCRAYALQEEYDPDARAAVVFRLAN